MGPAGIGSQWACGFASSIDMCPLTASSAVCAPRDGGPAAPASCVQRAQIVEGVWAGPKRVRNIVQQGRLVATWLDSMAAAWRVSRTGKAVAPSAAATLQAWPMTSRWASVVHACASAPHGSFKCLRILGRDHATDAQSPEFLYVRGTAIFLK